MLQFSSSSSDLDSASNRLRRSDRKRTKKIFKQDIMAESTLRNRTGKKHRSHKINENIPTNFLLCSSQVPLSLSIYDFERCQNKISALIEMKQAVNRQQIKYEQLLQIKLIAQSFKVKQNTKCKHQQYQSKSQNQYWSEQSQRLCHEDNGTDFQRYGVDCQRDLVRMATATDELYLQFQYLNMDNNTHSIVDSTLSPFNQIEYPDINFNGEQLTCRRKQSAIMLSDNYQNNQLVYNMEQLHPQWLREEYNQHVQW